MNSLRLGHDFKKISVYFFAFSMPFSFASNGIALFLLIISCFISPKFQEPDNKIMKWYFMAPIILYLSFVIGYLYSANSIAAIRQLELKSTIIIVPLAFWISRPRGIRLSIIAVLISVGISINILLAFGSNVLRTFFTKSFYNFDDPWIRKFNFGHESLSKYISFDPNYLSIYISISIFLILFTLRLRKETILYLALAIPFLILLSSKTAVFTFGCVSILYILFNFRYIISCLNKRKYIYIFIIIAPLLLSIKPIRNRLFVMPNINSQAVINEEGKRLEINNSYSYRFKINNSSIKILKRHPLLGVGTGDSSDSLLSEYAKIQFKPGLKRKFNAHNEFFDTWLKSGLIGLLSILFIFALMMYKILKKFAWLHLAFFITFFIFFCLESVLSRQKGVVFFIFFYVILFCLDQYQLNTSHNPKSNRWQVIT